MIPIIDVAPLSAGGAEGLQRVAAAVGAACRGPGFFAITGHGVADLLRADVFAAAQRFFARPEGEKRAVIFGPHTGNRGFVPMEGEALDPSRPADRKEAFNIGLDLPPDDAGVLAGEKFRAPNLWPEVAGFRETMLAYFAAICDLGRNLHRAFAVDLGLPPEHFADALDRPLATLRLLHYPPVAAPLEEGQLGAGTHTDYGNVTLLATDDVGGLQIKTREGAWLDAPTLPGAFICNIGDCLMRWTNDVYVSTPHRVVPPTDRARLSVAFFLDPNPDAIVSCLPTCQGPGRPAKYADIRGDDYLESRLRATHTSLS
ncbi:MAG: 2-oxoglutarate and iron-dependent oxygenase domain-containing protein [Pseudomonadota bacterium]